ncbi:MAG: lipopolysaccharide biosynthesis protein, partial [Proteobacteria bacterium]|nr:lipopolysaccharide biosynthesis protein [Pseudomonadota bacterium]
MSEGMKDLIKLKEENAGGNGNENLPSTEVRESISAWDKEEVNLRDYLNVIIRRKWLIMGLLGLTFISTLIFTLSTPKIYKASACIEVTPRDQKVTKFEEVVSTEFRAREFYETQVEMLRNNALALRVIKKLRLVEDPVVIETLYGSGEPGAVSRIKDFIASFVTKGKEKKYKIPLIAEEALKQQGLLGFIGGNLVASPSRNSTLINISFTSPDRQFSQKVVNTFADEFVHWRMEKKLDASQLARDFLMKQIDRAKISLENAEEELNRFAKQAGIVSLDSKLNSIYGQLEGLNSALAVAETDLIGKKAVYRQAVKDGPSHLPQVLASG